MCEFKRATLFILKINFTPERYFGLDNPFVNVNEDVWEYVEFYVYIFVYGGSGQMEDMLPLLSLHYVTLFVSGSVWSTDGFK